MLKSGRKVYLIARAFPMSLVSEKKSSPSSKSAAKNGMVHPAYSDVESSSTGSNESTISNAKKDVLTLKNAIPLVAEKRLSKSLRKKFFHHFPNVEDDEEVLKRYAAALQNDVLLQGYLYITTNYFAFYSNVFGFVTKILIPILTVENITKEKTARIFNTAIGIVTAEQKHVFGSLIFRENVYEYMKTVWKRAKSEAELLEKELTEQGLDYSDLEEDEVDDGELSNPITTETMGTRRISTALKGPVTHMYIKRIKRHKILLLLTTVLLVLLYTSAALLLYRISQVQNRYSLALEDVQNSDSQSIYRNIMEIQADLYTRSDSATQTFLDSNLDQIAKVKKSLEALSSLLVDTTLPKKEYGSQQQTSI